MKQRVAAAAITVAMAMGALAPLSAMATNGDSSSDYSSYSVQQLESLITKLQKLLAEKKAASLCFVSEKDLSLGDGEGDDLSGDVRRLQDFLREKGMFSYKSTGYFGKVTRTSVIAYQKSVGVAETGAFDAATRAKAHAAYCKNLKKPVAEKKEAPKPKEEKNGTMEGVSSVKSIKLEAGNGTAEWSVEGKAPQGFKVAWSKTSGATYPPRGAGDNVSYYAHPDARKAWLNAFDGAGTYYVRVCEYIGGKVGTCSNEVQIAL